ncbi:DUF1799 domain-containing protein [Comamonas odontotermitis]|uniref:DUF1799 domain-containing protein n=1 Tax=Comamonas odontotermitis TaxID=379895 RepID=UPI001CC7F476|nr:DUF1799 domain-containing protein [Comamonas odontotermitis]UBB18370.1 DUF1799 domain-containing protein [Comamonas odontotermitis]
MSALYPRGGGAAKVGAEIKMAGAHNLVQQEPVAPRSICLFIDNIRSYEIFRRFRSQVVSVGMGGIVGLNYVPVHHYLDKTAKDDDEWEDLFSDFQACEAAMVEAIQKIRD